MLYRVNANDKYKDYLRLTVYIYLKTSELQYLKISF